MNNAFEIHKPKKVIKKYRSSNCFQHQVDGDDENGTIDTVFTGDKCKNTFEREIDENTLKSNNDIMDKVMVNDEHHLHSCHTSSNGKNEQVLNNDEIKLMSLLESVEHSRLYQYHN